MAQPPSGDGAYDSSTHHNQVHIVFLDAYARADEFAPAAASSSAATAAEANADAAAFCQFCDWLHLHEHFGSSQMTKLLFAYHNFVIMHLLAKRSETPSRYSTVMRRRLSDVLVQLDHKPRPALRLAELLPAHGPRVVVEADRAKALHLVAASLSEPSALVDLTAVPRKTAAPRVGSTEVIDLDSAGSSAAGGAAPRGAGPGVAADDDDDEVQEVSMPARASNQPTNTETCESLGDGVELVGSSGGLLASDLPHARAQCPLMPFKHPKAAKRAVGGNERICSNCWCFVCETPAARCSQWSSKDAQRPAHCNAHDKGAARLWLSLRETERLASRRGDRG